MAKSLSCKVGTYKNQQGETKNKYARIGAIMSNNNGEFILLDPTVNLAGILLLQNAMTGEARSSIMVSVFDDANRQQAPAQPAASPAPQQQSAADSFDDADNTIPF